jgi:hypothetical protein
MLAEQVVETSFSFSNDVPSIPERRGDERLLKILRVGTVIIDDRRELCLIRNISAGGVMAHVYSHVLPGQAVVVELKTNQPVQGRIVWVSGTNAGIKFDEIVDVGDLLANPPILDNGWVARRPRVEIDRKAALRAGAKTYSVRALDISQSGVKVETDEPPEAGTELVVKFDGLVARAGVVRWCRDGTCGISFNQLVPFGELVDWLKREA